MSYEIDTTEVEHNGYTIAVKWYQDEDTEAPWDNSDCHGPVSDWTRREKSPGERVLCEDRSSKRYYDFAEAMKMARKDGWDTEPYNTGTAGERAVRAVEADFKYLQSWCRGGWVYVYYTCEVIAPDGTETDYTDSCGMIESTDTKYHETEAIQNAQHWIDNEIVEADDAASRDIMTVAA